jgi:predicted RND superfamily exporter protein
VTGVQTCALPIWLERYLATAFPAAEGYEARASGSTYLSVVLGNRILDSQTTSFGLSLLLIFLPIALMFGSLAAGAFTVPSNLFPILACLGFMGWAGVPLDISTTMIASIILGIAVDDTIHFVQSIRRLLALGVSHDEAVRQTLLTKGASAVWITFIISMGFVALVGSRFKPTASFGLLTAFGMGTGVVAELFLLPPLLVLTRSRLGVALPIDARRAAGIEPPSPVDGATSLPPA